MSGAQQRKAAPTLTQERMLSGYRDIAERAAVPQGAHGDGDRPKGRRRARLARLDKPAGHLSDRHMAVVASHQNVPGLEALNNHKACGGHDPSAGRETGNHGGVLRGGE